MRLLLSFLILSFTILSSFAQSQLSFQDEGKGIFSFDTGVVKGQLRADRESQGIPSLIDCDTGNELAYGQNNPGILSYYRLFSANKRWGDSARANAKTATLLPDGSVRIVWPPQEEQPFEMTAVYRWKSPSTLDLETAVKPNRELKAFEVFLSSYFNNRFKTSVYVKPTLHTPGDPYFLSTGVNPLVQGTYLAFPRDRQAARLIYDGRWEFPPHPVHFSVTKFFANPLCMKRDSVNGITVLLMSRQEDCFAVEAPYDMDPPDGIAGHNSVYFSLFGQDIAAGQTVRARSRLVVGRKIGEKEAIDYYKRFSNEIR